MTTVSAASALQISGISKTFPGQKALSDVNLEIRAGEVHALVGENGSGKSTLIRILAGFHLPDPGGEVLVRGEPLPFGSTSDSFGMGLRFVHQHLAIVLEMNAVENIALEAGFTRDLFINWTSQERLTRELLAKLNIEMDVWKPLADCRPVERAAVAIARALRPASADGGLDGEEVPLVVLDEPTSSLPAAEVRQLLSIVRDIASRGVAVLYVSHRLDEVFEIADRVSILRDGRLRGTEKIGDVTRESLIELIVGGEHTKARAPRVGGEQTDGERRQALAVSNLVSDRVRGISFTVDAGEIVGIIGADGSGREEVSRLLIGGTLPERGEVSVEGVRLPALSPRRTRRHGLVLAPGNTQPHSSIGDFTVRENLTLAVLDREARLGRLGRRKERALVDESIAELDIRPPQPERPYRLLSGGNQQKVILGKWLRTNPTVLVFDEPTAGIDVGARQAIYSLIQRRAAAGLAVVVCSSDFEDIVSLCGRALVMREGVIAAELSGNRLTEYQLRRHAIGMPGAVADEPNGGIDVDRQHKNSAKAD
ncbi:MAG TPA: sugar ABC transporter ATP-binding protein [Solirubrobacterales bacterium]|nr:sugar ABC transporter ATP-binding protein [Solirubrobacterales bacterium]